MLHNVYNDFFLGGGPEPSLASRTLPLEPSLSTPSSPSHPEGNCVEEGFRINGACSLVG